MSILRLNAVAEGNPPGAGQVDIFLDSADGELKLLTGDGQIIGLSPVGWDDWNLLMNGGFEYAQLQTPGTLTTYSSLSDRAHTADNWKVTNENASVQYQQIDTDGAPEVGLNARFYGKFKKITNAGKLLLSQVVSANDSAAVRGESVRLQFQARFSGSTSSMAIRAAVTLLGAGGTIDTIPATFVSAFNANGLDPTLGANLSGVVPATCVNGTITGSGATFVLSNAWQTFSLECDMPLNYKNILFTAWSNSQFAVNDEFNISECEICKGESVKDWSPFPSAVELARINSILCKTFLISTGPASNAGLQGSVKWMAGKAAAVALGAPGQYRFPTVMRAVPTMTGYNPSAAGAQARDITGALDCSATAFSNTSDSATDIGCTGNALTVVGNVLALHCVADASI